MTNATEDYDDFLDEGGHRWRRRLILLAVAAALVIAVVATLWATMLRDGGSTAAQTQTAKVTRGTITKTISTSATAASQSTANLSFGQSGLVTAVNVKVGQAVKQGDVVAQMDSQTLKDAVTRAQVSLNEAQTKLNTMLQGSTADELASADQAVIQAQSNLDKANTALQDLYNPTSDAVSAAQQAVLSAQSQLTKAQQARSALDTNWSDSKSAAQKAVDNAKNDLSSAEAKLEGAETACPDIFPSANSVPISSSERNDLNDIVASGPSSGSPTETPAGCTPSAASAILTANSAYVTSSNTLQTARDNLDKLGSGPDSNDVSVADASVQSAQLGLQTANSKLAALTNPAADDVNQAQQAVDSANSALTAAQSKRDTTYQGSTPEDIASQNDQVTLARIGVNEAEKNLQNAQIVAPFDGTVAALNINVGDTVGSGGTSSASSSSTSAIVLNTPNALVLNVSVGESDLPNVKVGQSGTATFDAITGTIFPIVIDSVGTNATTTQGVVTYQAKAHIVSGQSARATANGQSGGPTASSTPGSQPQAQATPGAQATASPQPVPGMNASVTIIVDQAQNVLMVPSAAIQRDGRNEVVNVQNDDGSTGRQTVETGLTNGTNTEITAGLEEGQTIIIPGATTTSTTASSQATPSRTGSGGAFFGGGGGVIPGAGGAGRGGD